MYKVKVYVLMLSVYFPKGHRRQGQPTEFKHALCSGGKKHTIRNNYDLWKKRSEEINSGNAVLSIRQWSGKPRRSKMVEIRRLTHLNVQKINLSEIPNYGYAYLYDSDNVKHPYPPVDIAHNDGLTILDFESWFTGYDLSNDMAVLHFCKNGWYL